MPRKKKTEETPVVKIEPAIMVGLVKKFEFHDPMFQEALSGHPHVGRVYRLIKDIDPTAPEISYYRLHVGRDKNRGGLDGILLGTSLQGDYLNKWSFDIQEVNKENFLDFDLENEDLKLLTGWFDTDHADLKKLLGSPAVALSNEQAPPGTLTVEDLIASIQDRALELNDNFEKFPDALDKIAEKDPELSGALVELVLYLGSTMDDKYEAADRPNFTKEFLLNSKSADVALFNAFKYLQRYATQGFEKSGNRKDLLKAIHYIMFEIIRTNRTNE